MDLFSKWMTPFITEEGANENATTAKEKCNKIEGQEQQKGELCKHAFADLGRRKVALRFPENFPRNRERLFSLQLLFAVEEE